MNNNRLIQITDTVLLFFCCLLVAARCQVNESFPVTWRIDGPPVGATIGLAETATMAVFAAMIATAAGLWLLVRLLRGELTWRKTALVGPFVLILIAGIVSTLGASNKHTALIGVMNLMSQMLLAILLVQLLDSPWKRRLMLCVVAATGVTLAYRCWEQSHYEIPETIKMFEQNPQAALSRHQLEEGTYQAEQFINRLKSRDVGGFFAISNTAASFFILSIMATLALISEKLKLPSRNSIDPDHGTSPAFAITIALGLALTAQLFGLYITQSKGGIIAFIAAILIFTMLLLGRRFFQRHWRGTIITALSIVILTAIAITAHGLYYQRLPGNSMWIRWQYWYASGKMIADHGLCGVGAENFGQYYTRYISPAVPEVVKDPHCFFIAMWSQWGLLGLIAVVWGILAVCVRLTRPNGAGISHDNPKQKQHHGYWWLWGLALAIGVMLARWTLSDLDGIGPDEKVGVYIISFLMPALVWLAGFILFRLAFCKTPAIAGRPIGSLAPLALGCGLLGFLLHNSIDFAIFRPGVGTCFFALVGTALAISRPNETSAPVPFTREVATRLALAVTALIVVVVLWVKVAVPVRAAETLMKQAQKLAVESRRTDAELIAEQAAGLNRLDPAPHYFLAKLHLSWWLPQKQRNGSHLKNAIAHLIMAIDRDRANYRYYRQLGAVYRRTLRGEPANLTDSAKAMEYTKAALDRFPVKSELLIEYGKLLLELGRASEALAAFEKALQSEHAYRDQQRRMYPDSPEIKSRLNPATYNRTHKQIQTLSRQLLIPIPNKNIRNAYGNSREQNHNILP